MAEYCDEFVLEEAINGEFSMEQVVTANGLPKGGTADQFLKKKSSTDFDAEWSDIGAENVGYDDDGTYAYGSVGGAISDLNKAISFSTIQNDAAITWEQGNIKAADGAPASSSTTLYSKRVRSANFIANEGDGYIIFDVPDGYTMSVFLYSTNSTSGYEGQLSIDGSPYLQGKKTAEVSNNYFKVILKYGDNVAFTPSDLPAGAHYITFVHPNVSSAYDLHPTGDTTDRQTEILNQISKNKVCRLAPGDYYITHFLMAAKAVIVGAGASRTRLIFKDTSDPYYAIRMQSECKIANLTLEAWQESGEDITPIEDYSLGTHGICIGSNGSSDNESYGCTLENIIIRNFTGCGVFNRRVGVGLKGTSYRNVRVDHCSTGIYLGEHAEYNEVIGCYCIFCYTGIIVMGGNNIVSASVFGDNEVNLNLKETDAYGNTSNDSHGIITGCKFTHAGYWSNQDPPKAEPNAHDIIAGAQKSAELISDCFIGAPIYAKDRMYQPLQFVGCQIRSGVSITSDKSKIDMFDCMFQNPDIVFTTLNNGTIRRRDCYAYDGSNLSTDVDANQYEITDGEKLENASDGHLKYITDFSWRPMTTYNSDGTSQLVSGASAPIKLHNTDYLSILCTAAGDDYLTQKLWIYFYQPDGSIDWTVFNYTNPTTGVKNEITIAALMSLNGLQFSNVPEGDSVRIAVSGDYIAVAVWDGERFGLPVRYSNAIYDSSGDYDAMPEDGSKSIVVPGSDDTYGSTVSFVIAKAGYTFVRGRASVAGVSPQMIRSDRFPAQVVPALGYSYAGRSKNFIVVKDYNYSTGEYSEVTSDEELMNSIVFITPNESFSVLKPASNSSEVYRKVKALTVGFQWVPEKDCNTSEAASTFKEGNTYSGIPYRSDWEHACYVGWHVTKHTFMNAVSDPDSIFYNDADGVYYGIVCSSFATLVTGFPYPMTNYGLMKNPHLLIQKVSQPAIGDLMTNGVTHSVVPLEIYSSKHTERYAVRYAEGIAPLSCINSVYFGMKDNWGGIGMGADYLYQYRYVCSPKNFSNKAYADIPYDVERSAVTGGSARPYKGDRSVFTSMEDVKINIKDDTANRLYYQKFNVTCEHGVPTTAFAADGSPAYVSIPTGSTQVTLRSKTTNGSYSGENLADGAVYGVWVSTDDSQTSAPSDVEYFEWHDVHASPISYAITDGVLVTDDVFWYARTTAANFEDPIRSDDPLGNVTIPYRAAGYTMNGTAKEHCDYSEFAETCYVRAVKAFFMKGKFGAYVAYADYD